MDYARQSVGLVVESEGSSKFTRALSYRVGHASLRAQLTRNDFE